MNVTPKFDRSPLGSTQSKINTPYWKTVLDHYDNGRFSEVLSSLLMYVNPELMEKHGDVKQKSVEIPHGSITVKITQTNDEIIAEAPFLNIANSTKVPLMRQVAQLNFYPLTITKIVLDDSDNLNFSFRTPLELCDPYKLYDGLREICINVDSYDDEFITKFKAQWIQKPRIVKYSAEELENIWNKVQSYISEAFEYINYLESKRIYDFLYDVLKSTFTKIDYYIAPQGFLRTEFEIAISDIDSSSPFNERIYRGKEFLTKLKNYDKNAFLDSIYVTDVFIPFKYKSNLENVRKNFQSFFDTAKDEISRSSFMGAFYTMHCEFLRLFYYNNVDDSLADIIVNALTNASQKPWEEAANTLFAAFGIVMDENQYNQYLKSYKK